MTFAMFAGVVAGILSLIAYIPRAKDIIKNKSSSSNIWLIWTASNLLIVVSYYDLGARTTIWVPLAYFIGSAFITVLTYRHSAEGWKPLHGWLLVVAAICATSWVFASNSLVALSINVGIYIIASVMVAQTRLRSQRKETWVIPWALYFSGAIINLLALESLSPEISAYPAVLFIITGGIFSITLRNHFRQMHAVEEMTADDIKK